MATMTREQREDLESLCGHIEGHLVYAYSFRILTARHEARCSRCEAAIQAGERMAWDGRATCLGCLTCKACRRFSESCREGRCPKCAEKAHAATPEGQAERKARRSAGAVRAAETRRLNACTHAGATSATVPYEGPPTMLKWDCPVCEKRRWTGLGGEDLGHVSEWA